MKWTLVCAALLLVGALSVPESFVKSFSTVSFKDLEGWTAVGVFGVDKLFYSCQTTPLVGGYKIFGAGSSLVRSFKFVSHYKLRIKLQFWKIDNWENAAFMVYVDDKQVFAKEYKSSDGKKICGNSNPEVGTVADNIVIDLDHNSPTATVVLTSSLSSPSDQASWGIRDFEILLERCPSECEVCSADTLKSCSQWKAVNWGLIQTDKDIDATGWTVTGATPTASKLAGVQILGGQGVFGKGATVTRKFVLPPHYAIRVSSQFVKIGGWTGEKASLTVDGTEVWKANYQYNQGYFSRLTGSDNDNRESFNNFFVEIPHQGNATLSFQTTLTKAADVQSWGIRDFFLYVARCSDNCDTCKGPSGGECQRCSFGFKQKDGNCIAADNFILLNQAFFDPFFIGIDGWTLRGNANGKTQSECGGASLVGGYNVFGKGAAAQKQFEIPNHHKLRIQVQFYKIDSWDDEFLYINVDGQKVWQQQVGWSSGGTPLCGRTESNWNELIINADVVVPHISNQVTIQFTSNLDQEASDESWGFREFRLWFESKPECAILYTECGFSGYSQEFCQNQNNFVQSQVPNNFQSIRIPPNTKFTVYENNNFEGRFVVFTTDQSCIQKYDWQTRQPQQQADGPQALDVKGNVPQGPSVVGGAADPKTISMDGLPADKAGPPGSPGIKRLIQSKKPLTGHKQRRH